MFLSLNSQTALWDTSMWKRDLEAMKTAQLRFFAVPHLARQIGPATAACPSGTFEAWFPLSSRLPTACFTQVGDTSSSAGTIGNILAAANATGLSVHLGLAKELRMDDQDKSVATLKAFADLQWAVAQQLWQVAFTIGLTDVVAGIYTEVEESNAAPWLAYMQRFASTYLQALTLNIKKTLRADLVVWASPYVLFNRTRFPIQKYLLPSAFAGLWEEALAAWAPALDVVAPQDSSGANGNSFADVRELLGNMSRAVARQRRSAWSNVELFEVWPRSCQWPDECHGRHPAPFSRIKAQLENEAPILSGPDPQVIAWEWTSCLSPTAGNGAAFPEANKANYEAYLAHIKELRNVYW